MASVVIREFRAGVAAGFDPVDAELLRNAAGGGPAQREMHRALMLADRAARRWAAEAIAERHVGVPQSLDDLPVLGKPEDGPQTLAGTASQLARGLTDPDAAAIAGEASALADAMGDLDTESDHAANATAFVSVAECSARILLAAGGVAGGAEFVVAEANEAMSDLIALDGWRNQLGPRFEFE